MFRLKKLTYNAPLNTAINMLMTFYEENQTNLRKELKKDVEDIKKKLDKAFMDDLGHKVF